MDWIRTFGPPLLGLAVFATPGIWMGATIVAYEETYGNPRNDHRPYDCPFWCFWAFLWPAAIALGIAVYIVPAVILHTIYAATVAVRCGYRLAAAPGRRRRREEPLDYSI